MDSLEEPFVRFLQGRVERQGITYLLLIVVTLFS